MGERMRVGVTGSAGFVGSHLCRALTDQGFTVIRYDKKTGHDLTDRRCVEDLFDNQPDIIVHLASRCSTPGSVKDPIGTFDDTVLTAVNVLDRARQDLIPVLLTSSVKARDGRTPYGAAKKMAETWAIETKKAYGLPVVINRPGTIYGPGQEGSDESGWIAWFIEAKRSGKPVTINGDGYQVRDLLHVSDYVRLLIRQIQDPYLYSGMNTIFDVGGGPLNAVTVLEIADYLQLSVKFGPRRYGDARRYIAKNNVPGWSPRVLWKESETFNGY